MDKAMDKRKHAIIAPPNDPDEWYPSEPKALSLEAKSFVEVMEQTIDSILRLS